MYDTEKDVENVALALFKDEWNLDWDKVEDYWRESYREKAIIALRASDAVKQLRRAEKRIKELEASRLNNDAH